MQTTSPVPGIAGAAPVPGFDCRVQFAAPDQSVAPTPPAHVIVQGGGAAGASASQYERSVVRGLLGAATNRETPKPRTKSAAIPTGRRHGTAAAAPADGLTPRTAGSVGLAA